MNFYSCAVDELLCHPDDKLSLGLILCKTRSRSVAEYALRYVRAPDEHCALHDDIGRITAGRIQRLPPQSARRSGRN
jgi:YhcG PDDEXK nuclease domain